MNTNKKHGHGTVPEKFTICVPKEKRPSTSVTELSAVSVIVTARVCRIKMEQHYHTEALSLTLRKT